MFVEGLLVLVLLRQPEPHHLTYPPLPPSGLLTHHALLCWISLEMSRIGFKNLLFWVISLPVPFKNLLFCVISLPVPSIFNRHNFYYST